MGDGYLWAALLKISAFVGIGMSAALFILCALVYRKRRKFGTILTLVVTLAVGLLGGSCWLLFQATLSAERNVLDRVDHQIMYIDDLRIRACTSLDSLRQAGEVDREHFERILDTSRGYLRELEQPIVDVTDLEWLNAGFRVDEAPGLSGNAGLAYQVGGLLGLFIAAVITLLASGYLTLRLCLERESAMNVGFIMASVVLVGSCAVLTVPTGDISPLVLTLLIPVVAAMLLHRCSRRESVTLLEITGGMFLILSVGLYVASSWALVTVGEGDIRKNLTVMNTKLPNVIRHAKRLGDTLDSLQETDWPDEEWSAQSACLGLQDAVGSLLEGLGYEYPGVG